MHNQIILIIIKIIFVSNLRFTNICLQKIKFQSEIFASYFLMHFFIVVVTQQCGIGNSHFEWKERRKEKNRG